MRAFHYIILFSALAVSCIRSYNVDSFTKPQVVLNSILTPDSVIKVDLWSSSRLTKESQFKRVIGSRVYIRENGMLILDAISANEQIVLDYHPKAGATYSITVESAGEPVLRAQTTVPLKPAATCTFVERRKNYRFYSLQDIETSGEFSSVLLAALNTYPEDRWEEIDESDKEMYQDRYAQIYTMSIFADKFNCLRDDYESAFKNSYEAYWNFMRVDRQNIDKTYPLTFSILSGRTIYIREDHDVIEEIYEDNVITVMTTSKDYDLYYKTLRIWGLGASQGNVLNFQPTKIHSNIEGGLGIFAAYNQVSFYFSHNL